MYSLTATGVRRSHGTIPRNTSIKRVRNPPEFPWHQQPDETDSAYQMFCAFRDAGRTRTLKAAWQIVRGITESDRRPSGYVRGWSSRFHWYDRAQAHDDYMELVDQSTKEKALALTADEWARTRAKIVADTQDLCQKVLETALAAMKDPATREPYKLKALVQATAGAMSLFDSTMPKGMASVDDPGPVPQFVVITTEAVKE